MNLTSSNKSSIEHSSDAENLLGKRQKKRLQNRDNILISALKLFNDRGYERATLREISQAAGLSTGAVFANFKDKEEIFETLLVSTIDDLRPKIKETINLESHYVDRSLKTFEIILTLARRHSGLFKSALSYTWVAFIEQPRFTTICLQFLRDLVQDCLEKGVSTGEIDRTVLTKQYILMIEDMLIGIFRRGLVGEMNDIELFKEARNRYEFIYQHFKAT